MGKLLETGDTHTLTKREREVLRLIKDGKSTKEIARELGIALKTVGTHRSHILNKLNPRKSVQADADGNSDRDDRSIGRKER